MLMEVIINAFYGRWHENSVSEKENFLPFLFFFIGRKNSSEMDSSRGHSVPQIYISQWCVELRNSYVGSDVLWRTALLGHVKSRCRFVCSWVCKCVTKITYCKHIHMCFTINAWNVGLEMTFITVLCGCHKIKKLRHFHFLLKSKSFFLPHGYHRFLSSVSIRTGTSKIVI